MSHCTVLIAAPDLLPALKERDEFSGSGELLAFSDAEAIRALETITKRRPQIVALERMFAATPRGAALINRIKADPSLVESEIRVVAHDGESARLTPRRRPAAPGGSASGGSATATAATATAAVPVQPLDFHGTRRAPLFKVAAPVDILVDGNTATLVDVSVVGAQVVTPVVLKPNQRIRMALTDDDGGAIRFNAAVAWAKFEIPAQSGPRYRAGIEFIDANAAAIDAYCSRHKV